MSSMASWVHCTYTPSLSSHSLTLNSDTPFSLRTRGGLLNVHADLAWVFNFSLYRALNDWPS